MTNIKGCKDHRNSIRYSCKVCWEILGKVKLSNEEKSRISRLTKVNADNWEEN